MKRLLCTVLLLVSFHRENAATRTKLNQGRPRYNIGTFANNARFEYEVTTPERVSQTGRHQPLHKHFTRYEHSGERTGILYYKLSAFGRSFQFRLKQNSKFVAPLFTVEHVYSDTQRLPFAGDLLHCFYQGNIQGDPLSNAVFNLCNGLRGSFVANGQRYFVEPVNDDMMNSTRNFRKYHIVYRHSVLEGRSVVNETSTCGLQETSTPLPLLRGKLPHPSNDGARSRRKRRGLDEAFVETMVTADKSMVDAFPSKADLQSYIITLMGVVAQVFRERSIGNPINIVLVKIVLLESNEPGLHVSTNAARTLRSFCRWQKKVMTKEKSHPEHHDTAILLTKRDICRQPGKCDTLGLAELGTMCLESKSCSLAEDSGLSTAYTISHELGHVFNLPHDGDNNDCTRSSGKQHLMAPSLSFDTKPWSWSTCSRDKLTEFLELGYGACLADKPHEKAKIKFLDDLPGELYSADKQCRMVFGEKSSLCPFMEPCRRLWCVKKIGNRKGCSTNHMPWADGTPCAKNKWCIRGQCVKKRRLKQIDGNWGEWAPYGECTRTCGGGISFSHRKCNKPTPENGGKYCIGSRKRFKSCNTQSCPKTALDFRYEQCARRNGLTRRGYSSKRYRMTQWLPKYAGIGKEDQCKLYCRMGGTAIYFKLNDKVIDGTPCNQETSDICVDGKCLPAGCDRVLYSKAKYDKCGVCNGDSSSCRRFSGTFNETNFGYNYIFTIPVGATHIVITQNGWNNKEDESFLALQKESGDYLLNGGMTIQLGVREFRAAGSKIWYSGSEKPFEQIKIDGKTTEPIKVLVLEVGLVLPPNVHYALNEVIEGPQKFKWNKLGPWSQCSHLCQGIKKRRPRCVRAVDGLIVSGSRCDTATRPSSVTEECNIGCRLTWHIQSPGNCSARCGPGFEKRIVQCMRISRGQWDVVLDRHCATLRKPRVHVRCEGTCEGTRWKYSQWSKCSKTCNGGIQVRQASCHDTFGEILNPRDCRASDKQLLTTQCNTYKCPWWTSGEWGSCSVTCGSGWQQRAVKCVGDWGQVPDRSCDPATKLLTRKPCDLESCPYWQNGEWSECSVSCGHGTMSRQVQCMSGKDVPRQESNDRCSPKTKPASRKECQLKDCVTLVAIAGLGNVNYYWRLSLWTPCSVSCGEKSGRQYRDVHCVRGTPGDHSVVEERHCEQASKPSASKICPVLPCTSWKNGAWGRCSQPCGRGFQLRVVKCTYDNWKITDDKNCDFSKKPLKRRVCQIKPCVPTTKTPAMDENPSVIRVRPTTMPPTTVRRALPTWKVDKWSECSKSCGEGVMQRKVVCSFNNGQLSSGCDTRAKPATRYSCNLRPCPRWITGEWNSCSVTCGQGVKQRAVECSDKDVSCDASSKPQSSVPCNLALCPKWTTGEWGECSATCGEGFKRRPVNCNGENARCEPRTKPQAITRCNLGPCPKWETGEWQECSVTCGHGFKRRAVSCVTTKGQCDASTKPKTIARCNLGSCPKWTTGEWSECSVTCGNGLRERKVECNSVTARCPISLEPAVTTRCNKGPCPQWKIGKWSQCSVTCGDGYKRRFVTCDAIDAKCDRRKKPESTAKCNLGSCPEWTVGEWGQCSVSCGNGFRKRTVECNSSTARCLGIRKPETASRCNMGSCPEWTTGQWSKCSVTCGNGVKQRAVECSRSDVSCDARTKPLTTAKCNDGSCPEWKVGDWRECSVTCGNGTRIRSLSCSRSDSSCDATRKPITLSRCNLGSCPKWKTGQWSKCSATCGNGLQERVVQCSRSDATCDATNKPSATARCNLGLCPEWKPLQWSQCSVTCGDGFRRRRVVCNGGAFSCDPTTKPETTTRCNLGPCAAWRVGQWTRCSVTCGDGFMRRRVLCNGGSLTCDQKTKPEVTAKCNLGSCPTWKAGQWTRCSTSCGSGFRERKVECDGVQGSCDARFKPADRDVCDPGQCPHWKIGEWAACSVTCGKGFKERKIECVTGVNATCDVRTKPIVAAKCNNGFCPRWNTGQWTECSKTCGEGIKRRTVACFSANNGSTLHESACDVQRKPINKEICNAIECVTGALWKKGPWRKCTVYCGIGEKLRDIWCSAPNGTTISDKHCSGEHKPKPSRSCNKKRRCGEWEFGLWDKCSQTCGTGGFKTRPIRCLHQLQYKNEMFCDSETRPLERVNCNSKPCPPVSNLYHWQTSTWSKCSRTCGYGQKSRTVSCVDLSRRTVSRELCNPSTKPDELFPCFETKCVAQWKAGHWTECSRSCGRGYQYRAVECVAKHGRPKSTECERRTKPPVWQPCNLGSCDGFVFWRMAAWSQCSATCGLGVMNRAVRCLARNGTLVADSLCDTPMSTKPDPTRPCHMRPCQPKSCKDLQTISGVQNDGEQTIMIQGKALKVFCYGMMSAEPKEYITLKTSYDNFAEIYPKILRDPHKCPANGSHFGQCDCEQEDYKLSGGSYFSKLRIDLTTMKIIAEDRRFASTRGLNPPPYGTAGDCYSAQGKCPQGRFSINLQETGLRLTSNVIWGSTGRAYSQIIYRYPEGLIVIGKCGGKCGTCRPDTSVGIQVETSEGDS